jgi:hypothetical protein
MIPPEIVGVSSKPNRSGASVPLLRFTKAVKVAQVDLGLVKLKGVG